MVGSLAFLDLVILVLCTILGLLDSIIGRLVMAQRSVIGVNTDLLFRVLHTGSYRTFESNHIYSKTSSQSRKRTSIRHILWLRETVRVRNIICPSSRHVQGRFV